MFKTWIEIKVGNQILHCRKKSITKVIANPVKITNKGWKIKMSYDIHIYDGEEQLIYFKLPDENSMKRIMDEIIDALHTPGSFIGERAITYS